MSSSSKIIPRGKYKHHIRQSEFLEGFNYNWRIGGAVLAICLFFVWSVQLYAVFGPPIFVFLAGYVIIVFGFTILKASQLEYIVNDESIEMLFLRPAELWDSLVDALTASGLIFAAATYLLTNTLATFTNYALIIALLLTVLLVPVAPMIASFLATDYLKTLVHVQFSKDDKKVTKVTIRPHQLERPWYNLSENEDLQNEVQGIFVTILNEVLL